MMQTQTVQFIILATTKVGEKSLVLHTLSEEWGRRSFIVSISRTSSMALYLPLNVLEAEVLPNSKSELWRLRSVSAVHPLNGLRGDVRKGTVSLFMSEVLFRTIRDGANEDGLYDWCVGSILTLNALEADFANFPVRFLLELAGALGFRPTFDDIAPFAGEHLSQMKALTTAGFSESLLLPLSGAVRNALCEELLQYLSYHTDANIQVKSLSVLRELYR
jgi:DNA repair protein RecO (recombination protein O)